MRGVEGAALLLLVAGCSFESAAPGGPLGEGGGADAAALAPPEPLHLRVSAFIDGRSRLVLSGSQVRWFHLDFSAPGRLGTDDGERDSQPTLIDGLEWWPTWPDVPDSENRDCGCGTVDAWTDLAVPVPQGASTAIVTPVGEMRGAARVIEQATVANDFAVVVELDDNQTAGGTTYVIDIDVTGP